MKILQAIRNNQNLWPRISLLLSLSFTLLSVIFLILGNNLLKDSQNHIIEQRLVIAEIVADQIDYSLSQTIEEIDEFRDLGILEPSLTDTNLESRALEELYNNPNLFISEIIFLDAGGMVVLAHPPNQHPPGSDLSSKSYVANAMAGNASYIATPWQTSPNNNLITAITMPVYGRDKSIIGWLCAIIDIDEISIKTQLVNAAALDNTAHAILVDANGNTLISTLDLPFLSPGEHATFYRQAIADGIPVVKEVPFELDLPDEPPGHHHIMAFAPVKSAHWGVFVGGDVFKETFAAPYRLFIGFAIFFIVSMVVVWSGTLASTKRLLEPIKHASLKSEISRQMANAKDLEELIKLIVQIPAAFLPVARVQLMMPNDSVNFKLVAEWSHDGIVLPAFNSSVSIEICEVCILAKNSHLRLMTECPNSMEPTRSKMQDAHCLPLTLHGSLVGIMHIHLRPYSSLNREQIDTLSSIASDIAITIESAQLQRLSLDHVEITHADRRRIARKLHDTIGQNLSFLRLKLDEYSGMDSPVSASEIHNDMKHLRDIANEAYEQVRNTLTDLHSETKTNFMDALRSRTEISAKRAHFKYRLLASGEPFELSQRIKSQVLFIASEALGNVEKHAHATMVEISLFWDVDELTMTIADNGSGLNMGEAFSDDHYGLKIMQERSGVINGKLQIETSPNAGTKIILWVPQSPV